MTIYDKITPGTRIKVHWHINDWSKWDEIWRLEFGRFFMIPDERGAFSGSGKHEFYGFHFVYESGNRSDGYSHKGEICGYEILANKYTML